MTKIIKNISYITTALTALFLILSTFIIDTVISCNSAFVIATSLLAVNTLLFAIREVSDYSK